MFKVLIISPHFPPANASDVHRVRILLPFFSQNGITAEVLAVEADQTGCSQDPWLLESIPDEIPVHRVNALGRPWSRIPGFGSLGFRARRAMARKGDELLASGSFDLIYFSTTIFPIHVLGPRWKRKFGVPFVMDYQDPWVTDYYREHPGVRPPGGKLKYSVMEFLNRRMEPRVLRECAGITSVSPAYPLQLAKRYPWLPPMPALVQPFPANPLDLELVTSSNLPQSIFDPSDGRTHWVYTGVVIPGMDLAILSFFKALRDFAPEGLLAKLTIHFIGTHYSGPPVVVPLAERYGLANLVQEQTQRIPYSEALACLRDADALLVFGSDDPGYTASKIYPYLLARKPCLTVFHRESSVTSLLQEVGGAVCIPFSNDVAPESLSASINQAWLTSESYLRANPLDAAKFEPYSAAFSARCFSEFFRSVVRSSPPQSV